MAEDVLQAWLAREQEVRAAMDRGPGPGVNDLRKTGTLTGLAFMQAMIRGEVPSTPIGRTLDFLLVEVDEGRAVFQGTPGPAHYNPSGTIHGGWYATLLDSALGCAISTKVPPGRASTTAELSVNVVKAIPPGVRRVRAEARALHCGRQLATAEGRLVGPDGTLYAHGTTTCLVFETRQPDA